MLELSFYIFLCHVYLPSLYMQRTDVIALLVILKDFVFSNASFSTTHCELYYFSAYQLLSAPHLSRLD